LSALVPQLRWLLPWLALSLIGCGGEDDRPPVWRYIAPVIMAPNCATASCHDRLAAVSGLDFSTPQAGYRSLTGLTLPTAQYAGKSRELVQKGNPAQSHLIRMLRADGVDRMPPDRPLAEADIRLIERWILDGAQND
jgi:hypothetical protein